jgi:hypothetical protein
MTNPNCDGFGPCSGEEVKALPIGRNPDSGNAILCKACFEREVAWRESMNSCLAKDCRFSLPAWDSMEVYHGS